VTTFVANRVAAGAAWLDQDEPGWDARIDLDRLDLSSGCRCILGQLDGGFGDGMEARSLSLVRAAQLGFTADWDSPLDLRDEWAALTAAWRDLITARRAES
jgi:hypothetical protein